MRALTIVQTMSVHDGEPLDWWAWESVDQAEAPCDVPRPLAGPPPAPGAVYGQLRHVRFAATGSKPG